MKPKYAKYPHWAGLKKEVGDEETIEQAIAAILSDAAYGAGWDGDTNHAPSRNAVYDKLNLFDSLQNVGGDILTSTADGIVTMVRQSGFHVYRTAMQAVPVTTYTKVQFNNEEFDTQNEFDSTVNFRFTAKKAGGYAFGGVVTVDAIADTKIATVKIMKNGADYVMGTSMRMGAVGYGGSGVSVVAKMAINDYMELFIYQDTEGNKNIIAGHRWCYFWGAKIA